MFYKVLVGDKIISTRCSVLNTIFSKFRGLMFRNLKNGESIILESKREGIAMTAIHMFFVFYPIDVLWLDSDMNVVDKRRVYPFMPYAASRKPAKYVFEIKNSSDVKIGDYLKLIPFS